MKNGMSLILVLARGLETAQAVKPSFIMFFSFRRILTLGWVGGWGGESVFTFAAHAHTMDATQVHRLRYRCERSLNVHACRRLRN